MNLFAVLRKQVKTALNTELTYDADVRASFDWQFTVNCGGQTYLVGKTGANTCYYRGPTDHDLVALYPDELLKKIDEWSQGDYVSYRMWHKPRDKVCGYHGSPDVDTILAVMPPKFMEGLYIQGIRSDGTMVRLYRLKKGLSGMRWVKLKQDQD